jgi:hypothetical protein
LKYLEISGNNLTPGDYFFYNCQPADILAFIANQQKAFQQIIQVCLPSKHHLDKPPVFPYKLQTKLIINLEVFNQQSDFPVHLPLR